MKPKLKDAYILDDFAPFVALLHQQLIDCDEFDRIFSFTNEEDLILALKSSQESKVIYLFIEFYLKNNTLTSVFNHLRASPRRLKVIYLSTFTYPGQISGLLKLKPEGIVHKADKPQDIISCIESVGQDKTYYSGIITQLLIKERIKKRNPFTTREKELLSFWARGYSVEKTAEMLSLSFHTVVAHRRNMFKKISCTTIDELLAYSKLKKIID